MGRSSLSALLDRGALLLVYLLLFCGPDTASATGPENRDDSSGWQWQNPLPQGNSLYDVHFVNEDVGFAVSKGGGVMRTHDGGLARTLCTHADKQ